MPSVPQVCSPAGCTCGLRTANSWRVGAKRSEKSGDYLRGACICSRGNITRSRLKVNSATGRHCHRLFEIPRDPSCFRIRAEAGTIRQTLDAPIRASEGQHAPLKDRATYGNPTHVRGLRHEPVNEQGVVLLFGMLAKELGYLIEAVQNGFPGCVAKGKIGPERWQRVQIEFEFGSRNFQDHGHPSNGCDVNFCWRHDWDDCPEHIEVLELSSAIKSLASSEA